LIRLEWERWILNGKDFDHTKTFPENGRDNKICLFVYSSSDRRQDLYQLVALLLVVISKKAHF
jgi:hypothetical protein